MAEKSDEPTKTKTTKRKLKFMRRDWKRYSKLGKGRKKKQKWKRPTGRDNKMREKRTGYPAVVSIGYKTDQVLRGKINGKKMIKVNNLTDLARVGKDEIAVLGNIGKRKKLEIAKKAKLNGTEIQNLDVEKFIKLNEKVTKPREGKK